MNENDKINELDKRLALLLEEQTVFLKEMKALRNEIQILKWSKKETEISEEKVKVPVVTETVKTVKEPIIFEEEKEKNHIVDYFQQQKTTSKILTQEPKTPIFTQNLEQFIGENLISKIGILIMIIGVVIGARYTIEHDLISPLTRIILGYLVGIGLLVFGIKLKEKYENYGS